MQYPCFGLFLNLNISGTPQLTKMIFFIHINNKTTSSEPNNDETFFLFKLFNVEVFGKKLFNRQARCEFHNVTNDPTNILIAK